MHCFPVVTAPRIKEPFGVFGETTVAFFSSINSNKIFFF